MENFHQMLLTRHSIRRYTSQPVSGDNVKTILEAALLAPTSKNARSWQFVVVEDKEMLQRLSECKPSYATSIKDATFAVVVTASPERSEAFVEDATVAAIFMHLQAAALGIGSCWVQVRGALQCRRRAFGRRCPRLAWHTARHGSRVYHDIRLFR